MLFRNANIENDLVLEAKYKAKLEYKQRHRAEILDRLLDGKNRAIGLDMPTLALQIEEKRKRELVEAGSGAIEAAENARLGTMVDQMRAAEVQSRTALKREVGRAIEQQMEHLEQRDSYALNAKHGLRTEQPVRMGDDDPRLGPCSAQVFGGEDLLAGERKKLQAVQMQTWLRQQWEEKEERARAEKEEEYKFAATLAPAIETADRIYEHNRGQVDARGRETSQYNLLLAEEVRRRRAAEKVEERLGAQVAMETLTMRGAGMGLLAEDIADGMSASDARRYRPDYYRGKPGAGPHSVRAAYEAQQAEHEAARRQAVVQEEGRVREEREELRGALLQERRRKMREAETRREAGTVIQAQIQAREAIHRAEREENRTTPAFGQAFFEPFGKSLK